MAAQLMCLVWNGEASSAARRYALKALSVAHQIGKSPIQIAIPNNTPTLLDLNMVRPTITLSLLLDKKITGETITGPSKGGGTAYKVPTKQDMEYFVTENGYDAASKLTLMLLHEDDDYEQYEFAVQQFTTNLMPSKEDRYDSTLVMLVTKRTGTYDQLTDD
jgi:hypothetical protein|tara:strand:+ start:1701 stop:2186 length:486 start_codon:yes stop_codon:yes gene_type:complete